MVATLAQHIAARDDAALRTRIIAALEQDLTFTANAGVWIAENAGRVVAAPISEGGASLAEIKAAGVPSDDQIRAAVAAAIASRDPVPT